MPLPRAVVALLALLCAGAGGGSAAASADRVLLDETGSGDVWHTIPVTTQGAEVAATMSLPEATRRSAVVVGLFRDGRPVITIVFVRLAPDAGVIAQVDGGPLGDVSVRQVVDGDSLPGFGAELIVHDPAPGQYTWLAFAAGDTDRWDLSVRGGSGVALSGQRTQGDRTWVLGGEDFRGQAMLSAFASGLGGRVNLTTERVLEAERGLVGVFVKGLATQATMGLTPPVGPHRTCPCAFDGSGGPGRYVFDLTGAGAGPDANSGFPLVAADVGVPH